MIQTWLALRCTIAWSGEGGEGGETSVLLAQTPRVPLIARVL